MLRGFVSMLRLQACTDDGVIRSELELAGTPIGGDDLLISAQAVAVGCVIVTDNRRENWLRRT